ncbi:hypothetical protein BDZ45DRAFT_740918 [Acephala macrosclerotiorum]|nr:hypothetical protein BDZ45DRAFT_740918 [Acephala macrosclerotiorum]
MTYSSNYYKLDDLCQGKGLFSGVDIIKSIKVSKGFKLEFERERDDWEPVDYVKEKLYLREVRKLLLPDSLRSSSSQEPPDEKTRYLMARDVRSYDTRLGGKFIKHKATRNQSSTAGGSGSLAPARIPRVNGYGDFCFGRLTIDERTKVKGYSRFYYDEGIGAVEEMEEWIEQEISENSGNARVVELDGFERYVDSPIAILNLIYLPAL